MKGFRKQCIRAGLAAAALATGITPAMADGPGWTPISTVAKVVDTADGGVNVRLTPDVNGCVSNSGYGPHHISIYPNHPGINRIKATLLLAYVNGTPVRIFLSDNTCKATEVVLGGDW